MTDFRLILLDHTTYVKLFRSMAHKCKFMTCSIKAKKILHVTFVMFEKGQSGKKKRSYYEKPYKQRI